MKSEGLTICPVTSRELSGSLGGVVASNVVSAADLKWATELKIASKSIENAPFGADFGSISRDLS